ncbi:hypothetical protein VA596_16680 [Amycolatopsis sp., V23-08]|jgi:hypothetical protein|uniref:Uncharacterized protein n=1 Tax=Amycolatopsis heterodermiae TaxID=3110235 RepID=A0ABU5R4Q3_9PSEU|nr:hypothetical protein [Amycolatopsis sp., V23-08]MEA5361183.1 hypothetical protein [Amycolatopsis sp., V23-08]
MDIHRCPRCGWPLAELPAAQPVSRRLEYVRCVCGSWLARLDGQVVGATKGQLTR